MRKVIWEQDQEEVKRLGGNREKAKGSKSEVQKNGKNSKPVLKNKSVILFHKSKH